MKIFRVNGKKAKRDIQTDIHTYRHTYRQTDRLPLVVLSAAVAANNMIYITRKTVFLLAITY